MKTKHILLMAVVLLLTIFSAIAQDPGFNAHSVKNIPFGKKLPPPDLSNYTGKLLPQIISPEHLTSWPGISSTIKKDPGYFKQLLLDRRKMQASVFQNAVADAKKENENIAVSKDNSNANFHLVKDINALSESNAHNYNPNYLPVNNDIPHTDSLSFAVLDNVIYFVADDGIHGNELWRSDGTDAGTFLLKDIQPEVSDVLVPGPSNITALNGKIYFISYSNQLWVSDGTENGTQSLNIDHPTSLIAMDNKVYFAGDGVGYLSAIWTTDGTIEGTRPVVDIGSRGFGGEQINQVTPVNGLLFFTFLDYETLGWQIWRSDLTDAGTYHVGPTYPFIDPVTGELTTYVPAQLTSYANKLCYSANDGTGRKLWISDGTDAGTRLAPGNQNVIIEADYLGTSFSIVNNILCVPGEETPGGNSLYKYDASDGAGLVKIKDFAAEGNTAFIVRSEMEVAGTTLYFKVINSTGGVHDELWSSKGTKASTRLVYKLLPGESLNNLYNGNGSLYFVKSGKYFGSELWRTFETYFGTFPILLTDIFKGRPGSFPNHLTAFKGGLIFSAADEQKGNELFITNKFGFGATLVKDINIVTTSSALAGYNPYVNFFGYPGIIALGNDAVFTAYERVHGRELYKSDGTAEGTKLLNDVVPGDAGFESYIILSKNNTVYFLAISNSGYSIYKTKGTKKSLRKITPDYRAIIIFSVADNGLVFYEVYNYNTAAYELWRSDGTPSGTYLLSSTLNTANQSYLNVVGNTALFVAGDAEHGYELWRSDGSVAGTRMVKDINPGKDGSTPGGMFIYKNEVYFSAYESTSSDPSFWKSNGTGNGTIKLADIDPWWDATAAQTGRRFFCVSNNILYFSAVNHADVNGTQLWKTDGTVAGTEVIKDINPANSDATTPGPQYLTDVNGTIFFYSNDGEHGIELWKTDGTKEGTQLVKDLTPGSASTFFSMLVSAGGKLYFSANVNGNSGLWYSDGTPDGTKEITDPGLSGVRFSTIYVAGNKLFLPGYTSQLGLELYVGTLDKPMPKFAMAGLPDKRISIAFDAVLYPNPTASNATLQLTGNTKNVSVAITDMSGKKLWQSRSNNAMFVTLPTAKFAAGTYFVTINSETGNKTIKLVKQ